jgi:hypothetical protein
VIDQLTQDLNWSAVTFRHCTAEKLAFIILNVLDLILTLVAVNLGFKELNPVMSVVLSQTPVTILLKLILPVTIAWVTPGRWLKPAIILLLLVLFWDIHELVLFFF